MVGYRFEFYGQLLIAFLLAATRLSKSSCCFAGAAVKTLMSVQSLLLLSIIVMAVKFRMKDDTRSCCKIPRFSFSHKERHVRFLGRFTDVLHLEDWVPNPGVAFSIVE